MRSCVDRYAYRNESAKGVAERLFVHVQSKGAPFRCKLQVAGIYI